ncbi:MAG: hypothetical protein ACTHMB_14710 [Candidatus Binatia bacterium]
MKLRYTGAPLSLIGSLVLWLGSAAFGASADSGPPDREMLRMMDLLREMDMIKQLDILQDMHNLQQGDVSAKSAPPSKSAPPRQKETAR